MTTVTPLTSPWGPVSLATLCITVRMMHVL